MTQDCARPPFLEEKPFSFDEFFQMNADESLSPFLKKPARRWAHQISLRASLISSALLLIAFLISMWPNLLPLSHMVLMLVYFLVGVPSLIESIEDLLEYNVNIDVLMTLAAFCSVFIGGAIEGGLLLVLFSLSGAMENAVTFKARRTLKELHRLNPNKAYLVDAAGQVSERSTKDIQKGDHLLVRAGEIVPLDGTVIQGTSEVNLVHLTGETAPVLKKVGDAIPSGAQLYDGSLTIAVTHVSADSTVSRILRLIIEAEDAKPKMQTWFDSLSRVYASSIISIATLLAIFLPKLIAIPFLGPEGSLYRALTFLIAASPCALIIAIPIAYLSAISAYARRGVILKGGVVIDRLTSCRCIAFDKTGTLTTGDLSFSGLEPLDIPTLNPNAVLSLASSLEQKAVHPFARSILAEAKKLKLPLLPVESFVNIPGKGVSGHVLKDGKSLSVYIGRPDHLDLAPAIQQRLNAALKALHGQSQMVSVIQIEQEIWLFKFQDALRPQSYSLIQTLKKKFRLVMLTGDHAHNAQNVASSLSLTEVYSELSPAQKLEYVAKFSEEGLAMIGDGINDAPALARATVGICIGQGGSQAAAESADVILLSDRIELISWLFQKAAQAKSIVRMNLFIAVFAMLIASIPALFGLIPLWLAVILHEGGTVLVGLNALRLLRR
ncbi:MAG: hMA1 [Chlamydiales bacterium]|jgi:heavy metal translocating P-type ATPase|nr:hMA1 [Chlamydiales bacterium]